MTKNTNGQLTTKDFKENKNFVNHSYQEGWNNGIRIIIREHFKNNPKDVIRCVKTRYVNERDIVDEEDFSNDEEWFNEPYYEIISITDIETDKFIFSLFGDVFGTLSNLPKPPKTIYIGENKYELNESARSN